MKLVDFGRWTTTKATLAVAGALVIAGAVGSAIAMSPIVEPPIKWQGGAEFAVAFSGGPSALYVVPAGRNFILTDLMVGNGEVSPAAVIVFTGAAGSCSSTTMRVASLTVPAKDALHLPLQTGIGFASGQAVCIYTGGFMNVSGRGFLFTAAPAS